MTQPVFLDDGFDKARALFKGRFATVIEYYLEDAAGYLSQIKAALEGGDASGVARAAHPFKSASRQVGAGVVGELAYALECAGKSGTLNACAGETLADLETAFERTSALMQAHCATR